MSLSGNETLSGSDFLVVIETNMQHGRGNKSGKASSKKCEY